MFLRINLLLALAFFSVPLSLLAAVPIVHTPALPYQTLAVDAAIETKRVYLGELVGDPHMFEVTIAEPRTFSATLLQHTPEAEMVPFSMIVVRSNDNNRGVTEIGRVAGADLTWEGYYDASLGMHLLRSVPIAYELTPGVYRFEVSTAENFGKYMIVLGTDKADKGYGEAVEEIRIIQDFFGVSSARLLLSTYILYPLGSLIIIGLILYALYRHRTRFLHA
jgi:hypothetical protein